MKKIGICTLHDAYPNFGATLQAFALQETIKKMGYAAEFLKFKKEEKRRKNVRRIKLRENNNSSIFTPKDIKKITINKGIKESNKFLNISKNIYSKNDKYDSVILGSDELWNLNNPSFEHRKEYFGYNLNCNNIFTYAPSANGTTKEEFEKYYNNELNLSNIKKISARDKVTVEFIKNVTNKDAEIVLDPTLLIENFEEYAIMPKEENYILIYAYRVSDEIKNKIKKFAKKKKLKVYSIGFYNGWADKNIDANIFEFLGYMKKAKYIVTATFHGTLFSIIFKKQFVSVAKISLKIEDILKRFQLNNRDISYIEEIESIIDEKIDYNAVEEIKTKYRENSMKFLKTALNGE